jgi:hypothetical protein
MEDPRHRLSTAAMAAFVADGFLRFDALIPEPLNRAALEEMKALAPGKLRRTLHGLGGRAGRLDRGIESQESPESLTPLEACYPAPSALGAVLRFPAVAGIIESLVGANPAFDHDFIHHIPAGAPRGQHLHVDAVLEPAGQAFDIQLFYFPTAVAPGGGGTRFVPGSHLRRARAEGIARYQHVLGEQHYSGPAGTLLVFHQGLWHAGQPNPSAEDRWMYKLRLNPREPQQRLWNTSDLAALHNSPRDHSFAYPGSDTVAQRLRRMAPWQRGHEGRYEQMQRAALWRYLTGDLTYDVDFYQTRKRVREGVLEEEQP